jgi:BlaI family penicillinase repressor
VARPSSKSKHPTELELQILQVLWQLGDSPGSEIRTALEAERSVTYQSVMTVLGIMENKGFVSRQKRGGQYRYRARVTQAATTKRMMRDLVDRLFGGSTAVAMINLLESSDLSDAELDQLRKEVTRNQKKRKP